ncbi:MAG: F0F1 ATP synthase subunit epsilon [Deltaproteobacteria bacterium]|nr:F0F1 ATP synthase subunit epsilon [Deltaproteobacteria bacterium]
MADTFLLEIVTPYRKLLSQEVEEMTATGQEGEFGVLAGHSPFLTILKPGEISYKKGSESGMLAISRGYAEVLPDKTTILVDSAEMANEIDAEAARRDLAKAEEALKGLTTDDAAYQSASDAYELAQAKLRVKEKRG